jgi:antirestriction protein ArdC
MAADKKVKYDKFNQEEVKDQHQILTDKIIAKMEEAVKYEKPWFENTTVPPYNPVTGTKYSGVNFLALLLAHYPDPRFYTFQNVKKLAEETGENIHVKKGEKGIAVFKAMQKTYTSTDKETGEEKSFGLWRQVYAGTVFNASQIEGIAPLVVLEKQEFEVNEDLEKITQAMIGSSGLKLHHHSQGRAYYSPKEDGIWLPHPEQFKSQSLYQRTLSHELGHSTGHEKRLNRDLTGSFGSKEYAYEELIAELSSYFMGAQLGFKYDSTTHENHAAYLKSWMGALQKDKGLIFKASSAASKVVEFQLKTKKEYFNEYTKEELEKIEKDKVAIVPNEEPVAKKIKIM